MDVIGCNATGPLSGIPLIIIAYCLLLIAYCLLIIEMLKPFKDGGITVL